MKRTTAVLAAIALCATYVAYADYSVWDEGTWPKTWPAELEPLREQARSLEGPLLPQLHYQIPFTSREQFESAWPHLLKVASKGAPIVLLKSPYTRLGKIEAGVFIHCPPTGSQEQPPVHPEESIKSGNYWRWATYIQLIVDGEIVDLNRIELPPETQIIDKRFEEKQQ